MRLAIPTALFALLALLGLAAPASAAVLEPVGSYSQPVYVTSDPSDEDRLFVVERTGRILLTTPAGTSQFVDLRSPDGPVNATAGEQGLLSIAFAPDFATSGLLYVYYTGFDQGAIHVGELRATGDIADPATLRNVITIPHAGATNHNGGQLQFGPDGYLYLGTGDGGGAGDPFENGQNLDSLLGKLIRIDPRRNGSQSYTVPPDNPLVGVAGADEIWSSGLRNPFRFSFDRLTGDLTIGDVGQNLYEEVDFAPASDGGGRGVNWGWDCREGAHDFELMGCAGQTFTDPVLEYSRAGGCSIDGGYVVRDPGLPELYGRYVYADFCAGVIRSALLAIPAASDDRSEALTVTRPVSFGEDACGRIYVVSIAGPVSRLGDGTPTDCAPPPPPPPPPPPDPPPAGPPGPPADPDPPPADPYAEPPSLGDCGPVSSGSAGPDLLRGGKGGQDLLGRGGDDVLRGESGDDCIRGGRGRDIVRGGRGKDVLSGGVGDDRLRARDGERDVVACGAGRDRVVVDRKDRLRGCERVRT